MRFQDKEDDNIYVYKRQEVIIGTNRLIKRLVEDDLLNIVITPKGSWCYEYTDGLFRSHPSLKELQEEEELTKEELDRYLQNERVYQMGYRHYTYWRTDDCCDEFRNDTLECIYDLFRDEEVEECDDFLCCVATDEEYDHFESLKSHKAKVIFMKKMVTKYKGDTRWQ